MLTDFQIFFTVEFSNKFAKKYLLHFPPHLKCVAALPCEIKIANFVTLQAQQMQMQLFWDTKTRLFLPTSYSWTLASK